MNLNIESGIKRRAIKCVIMGCEGIGKSTLAAQFPNPLFIDTENGTARMNVRRIVCNKSWEELIGIVEEVIKNPSICGTLIIDTADWAEQLAEDSVCTKNRVASIEGIAYGKGYKYLADCFNTLLKSLDRCIDLGINVVFTAHAKPRKYELPEEQGQFDRWEMKLTRQVSPLIKEWCDMLLFCNYKTFVITTENNTKKASGGKRVMYTTHNPCWDAKNRFGLPEEMELDYKGIAHLFEGIETQQFAPQEEVKEELSIQSKLKEMLTQANVSEEQLETVVVARGRYPEGSKLSDYSEEFITRWVIPNWKQIITMISEVK